MAQQIEIAAEQHRRQRAVVAIRGDLPDLSAEFRRRQRRRNRRPERRPIQAAVPGGTWRRRDLAEPVLPVTAGRRRLRRVRLPRRRPGFRHPGRRQGADRRIARSRTADRHRPGAEPHLRPARSGSRPRWRPARTARSAAATSSATAAARTVRCRRTTGCRTSAARPGPGSPTGSGTCTCSPRSSRTWTGPTRRSSTSSRTSCGSGWTSASTGSGSTSRTAWPRIPTWPTCPTGASDHLLTPSHTNEHPHWDRDEVHDVYRGWRAVIDEYAGDRVFCRRGLGAQPGSVRPVPAPGRAAHGVQLQLPRRTLGRRDASAR